MTRFWAVFDRAIEMLIFVIFLGIVIVGTMQVCNRFFLNLSLSWSEELQRYGQIWIVFLGIPVAYRHSVHIGMEMLTDRLADRDLGPGARGGDRDDLLAGAVDEGLDGAAEIADV